MTDAGVLQIHVIAQGTSAQMEEQANSWLRQAQEKGYEIANVTVTGDANATWLFLITYRVPKAPGMGPVR